MEKKPTPNKGLSDKELVTKYESGKINLSEKLKVMVKSDSHTGKFSDNKIQKPKK